MLSICPWRHLHREWKMQENEGMSAVIGGWRKKKKASSTIIYNLLHGWLMYVCPQMRNIYFRVHFSMRQTRFNKHSNHKHRHIWYQEHACSPYTVHLHAILEPRHIYERPKSACMQKKKKKKRPQQCKRADENKKSCSQTALSFNQWEVQNYACKKTEMLKSKITLCNIPGH